MNTPPKRVPKPPKLAAELSLKQAQRLKAVGLDMPSVEKLYSRVFSGVGTQRMAIKAFCLDCCGLDKGAIGECTADACPLWRFRPYRKRTP